MNILKRLYRFVKSLVFHIGRGSPKSSQSLINKRYAICKDCDYYSIKDSQCLQCGCNINTKQILLNKLAWEDQKCPLNKW